MPNLERLSATPDPLAPEIADILRTSFDPKSKRRETIGQLLVPRLRRRDVVSALTREVTPALLEALGEAGLAVRARAEVLEALYAIAVGLDGEAALARRIDEGRASELVGQGLTLAELRAPIVARGRELLAYLGDTDTAVRSAAALLASTLPEHRESAVAALEEALGEESDAIARYVELYALACHGVRREVPEPPAKNAVASILARVVRVLCGGPIDLSPAADASKLPMTVNSLLGPANPVQMVLYANVGELFRRGDPAALVGHAPNQIALALLAALWPQRSTPIEPRSGLTDEERRWLLPLYEKRSVEGSPDTLFARAGLIRGSHPLRLLGLESGPADAKAGDVPLWLLARRVVDERAPLESWTAALKGRSDDEVVAIVRDLANLRIEEPWPPHGGPYAVPSTLRTYARFFALVRTAFSRLPDAALGRVLEGERQPIHATALALLVDRGREVYATHAARIERLALCLQPCDVEAVPTIVRSLSPEIRATVLKAARPDTAADGATGECMLTGLWFLAEFAPVEVLAPMILERRTG
jgi:hypothetical protein